MLSFLILYSELVVSYSTSNIFIIENHYSAVVKSPYSRVVLLESECQFYHFLVCDLMYI